MKFTNLLTDDAVTKEIGQRIADARIARRKTQAEFADAAGVSKRTVERLEDGASTQLVNLIRCLRVLERLEAFERLLPDAPPNPIEQLRRPAGRPKRVRKSAHEQPPRPWTWGDEP